MPDSAWPNHTCPFSQADGFTVLKTEELATGNTCARKRFQTSSQADETICSSQLTMSHRLRYNVAMSLDGFIAPPDHSTGWIVHGASIDFDGLYAEFDHFVLGRRTYELMRDQGGCSQGAEAHAAGFAKTGGVGHSHVSVRRRVW